MFCWMTTMITSMMITKLNLGLCCTVKTTCLVLFRHKLSLMTTMSSEMLSVLCVRRWCGHFYGMCNAGFQLSVVASGQILGENSFCYGLVAWNKMTSVNWKCLRQVENLYIISNVYDSFWRWFTSPTHLYSVNRNRMRYKVDSKLGVFVSAVQKPSLHR